MCRLVGTMRLVASLCLVLELCAGGPLDKRLACLAAEGTVAPPLPWQQRVCIAFGVADALAHLHSLDPQIIHRSVQVTVLIARLTFCLLPLHNVLLLVFATLLA